MHIMKPELKTHLKQPVATSYQVATDSTIDGCFNSNAATSVSFCTSDPATWKELLILQI